MSSEHLLKVLSGNHQGAEVILGDESVVIGSGDDSDIVLTDAIIKEHHAKITFSGGTAVIQPMDGHAYVIGKLVKEEEATYHGRNGTKTDRCQVWRISPRIDKQA